MAIKKLRKAVFPVAGLGTRFLPATKANPKEMLPIVDKPLIQYAVEEALAAGITQMIFVTSGSKRAIEDHFDTNHELEYLLAERHKHDTLELVRSIKPKGISCIYVRQPEPAGLGDAVLCAKEVVGDEPFAVLLADDLIDSSKPTLVQMSEIYHKTGGNIIGVEQIEPHLSERYGIVKAKIESPRLSVVTDIVEKPKPSKAPSNLAVAGRYILQPEIFEILKNGQKGAGGEIQLTDAIAELLSLQDVRAYEFIGTRYDCGNKLGYVTATMNYALKHPEIGYRFKAFLEQEFQMTEESDVE
jgi:UTP--glucose-1-phosphate uridylyltransferase